MFTNQNGRKRIVRNLGRKEARRRTRE